MVIEYGENKKRFRIVDTLQLTKSSQKVSYGNLTVDFSEATIDDLPFYLQEIRIIDEKDNDKLIFTGYLNEYTLPELRMTDIYR